MKSAITLTYGDPKRKFKTGDLVQNIHGEVLLVNAVANDGNSFHAVIIVGSKINYEIGTLHRGLQSVMFNLFFGEIKLTQDK